MMKLKVISIVVVVVLLTVLAGCRNAEKEREEMIQKTREEAKVTNEQSDFGNCKLLTRGTDKTRVAVPSRMGDDKSTYLFFLFDDNAHITQIMLETSDYHVFGIRVGDDISFGEDALKENGYELSATNDNPKFPCVTYSKYYINIGFYTKEDNKITGIVITVSDPQHSDIIY